MKFCLPFSTHTPVLAQEVLSYSETDKTSGLRILDATFGRGGHTKLLMQKYPGALFVACDRDSEALRAGQEAFKGENEKITFVHAPFSSPDPLLEAADRMWNEPRFDLILVDLGVS